MIESKIKLTYYTSEGIAEPIRYVLAMSGEKWEDNRLTSEEINDLKPTLPYNQVPILEYDGKIIPQSGALLRFVGKIAGLYPEDPVEAAYADAAVDCVAESLTKLTSVRHEEDEERKAKMSENLIKNYLPKWMENLEKNLKAAGGEYYAGNKMSIGDIAVTCRLTLLKKGFVEGVPMEIFDDYPLLAALCERVEAEPKIVAYKENLTKK